jgi:hypothetical protein
MREEKSNIESKDVTQKKAYLIISSVIVTVLIITIVLYTYKRFSITEEEARTTSNKFFNMLIMENLSTKEFEELYPSFNELDHRVVLKKKCEINSLSKNSDGDFEVYSSVEISKNNSIPIYLLLSKSNGKVIIKSSKGVNYAYYNRILEYGKKKGCLSGNENDAEMGKIIDEKKLNSDLELETRLKMNNIYDNLKVSNDIKKNYGMISGNVTVKNNNDFDLGFGDIECIVEFYNTNGNIIDSQEIYLFEISAYGSKSNSVYSSSGSAASFKIIPTIKNTDALRNRIRDRIVLETNYGCK